MSTHRYHKRPKSEASSFKGVPRQSPSRIRNQSSIPPQRFLSIKDVADQLDVSPRSVFRWIATGDLVAHKLGRLVRVGDCDLREFLARRRGF